MSTITTRAAIARGAHLGWEIVDLQLDPDLVRLRLVELQVDDVPVDVRGPGDRGTSGDAHLLRFPS